MNYEEIISKLEEASCKNYGFLSNFDDYLFHEVLIIKEYIDLLNQKGKYLVSEFLLKKSDEFFNKNTFIDDNGDKWSKELDDSIKFCCLGV